MPSTHYYERHILFCQRSREARSSCAATGGVEAFEHCKARVRELGLAGQGRVRVNASGCLGRCEQGPVAVVYPEGVWYTFVDEADLDEIVESHLRHGRAVERLLL